jgi:hypothetical protein
MEEVVLIVLAVHPPIEFNEYPVLQLTQSVALHKAQFVLAHDV